ncbi:hemerythrin domain-containing protein [Bacillaceae bacterium W0354]
MSGPALHKANHHRQIHEGSLTEGRDLMDVLMIVYKEGHEKHSLIAAKELLDHWESRTIAHADSEDDGLFEDLKKDKPELSDKIAMMKRDHQLLRRLIKDIKQLIDEHGVDDRVIDRFKAFYILMQIHGKDEIEFLLK